VTAPKLCCPHCSQFESRVTHSRVTADLTQIWRRRQCLRCNELFTTYERVVGNYRKSSAISSTTSSTSTRIL